MRLEEMDLNELLTTFESAWLPAQIEKLANEIAKRGDSLGIKPLVEKYRSNWPIYTRIVVLKAIGNIPGEVSMDFFEKVMEEDEIDMEQLHTLFVTMCNQEEGGIFVHSLSYGIGKHTDREGWIEIAEAVIEELYPAGFGIREDYEQ